MWDTDNASEGVSRRRALQKGAVACSGAISGLAVLSGTVTAGPTEIDECTTIDGSGEYVLTDDLSSDGNCIQFAGGDVIINGNGYTISGMGSGAGISGGWASIIIRNLTIEGFTTGIIDYNSDMELENTVVTENKASGIGLRFTDLDVRNSTVTNNKGSGISNPYQMGTVRMSNSILRGNSDAAYNADEGILEEMKNCTVTNNGYGVVGMVNEIKDNEIRDNDGFGIGVHRVYNRGGKLGGTIIGNEIQNNTGPGIIFISTGADVIENTITNNKVGVVIREGGVHPMGGKLSRNNIEGNDNYGVKTESREDIEATCNYWGHATGPDHEDNPRQNPKGEKVSGNLEFRPWSVREIRDGEGSCVGGRGGGNERGQTGNAR